MDADLGLMDYKFRFYSPTLGRFILPDNIIPDVTNPQAWNRYSYVVNNPIKYNDPTGHCFVAGIDTMACAGILLATAVVLTVGALYLNETPHGRSVRDDAAKALERMQRGFTNQVEKKINELTDKLSRKGDEDPSPKTDPDWCNKNPKTCLTYAVTGGIAVGVLVYNSVKCAKEECHYPTPKHETAITNKKRPEKDVIRVPSGPFGFRDRPLPTNPERY
ncbi:MAG: RHS repeat-associated core domain-containing protein [Anaerolineales bacterium]|nr:RHS repeat-associated core domain-containing protein [Anaerolineales bacterium]MBX3038505.1 RHS repeat-associated core domain-containing protein [Anaerolineales bacterium]